MWEAITSIASGVISPVVGIFTGNRDAANQDAANTKAYSQNYQNSLENDDQAFYSILSADQSSKSTTMTVIIVIVVLAAAVVAYLTLKPKK